MSLAAVIGVDAHPDSITGVLVNHQGQKQTSLTVSNDETGITQLLSLAREHQAVLAVENAKAFGLNLTREAIAQDTLVYDIPANRVAGLRSRRAQAKNDERDAINAAVGYLNESTRYAPVRLHPVNLELRCLERTRASLVRERVRLQAQHKAFKHQAFSSEVALKGLETCISTLSAEIKRLTAEMSRLLEGFDALLEESGVGKVIAGVLIGECSDVTRFKDEAAFAAYAGVAPLERSSGNSKRVRVNRGGNRRLNAALETVTLVRVRRDERTRVYFEKKIKGGMGKRQAFRATKRVVCRALFRVLRGVLT